MALIVFGEKVTYVGEIELDCVVLVQYLCTRWEKLNVSAITKELKT